jgi:dGTPase
MDDKASTLVPLYSAVDSTRRVTIRGAHDYRSEFRRDYARLVHSPAFRRLQGKTQLFPGVESDFFRNRLTHSLEVAQIAKSIASKINHENSYFSDQKINTDLVETASLGHDLGHPPFGHNGEYALDECMRNFGGFEGNAQTLRIVASVAKKEMPEAIGDSPAGLNFTHRTIGALLKYDNLIKSKRPTGSKVKIEKGYYKSEKALVEAAKKSILGGKKFTGKFKTIECAIMDIADDIAYSTYDLEDALKAGFITPLEILRFAYVPAFLKIISKKVKSSSGIDLPADEVSRIFLSTFGKIVIDQFQGQEVDLSNDFDLIRRVVNIYASSKKIAADGYARTAVTSQLVNEFIGGVGVELNAKFPSMSAIKIDPAIHAKIEVLKHFTYEALIMSPRLKIVEYRGRDIVKTIFKALTDKLRHGYLLLPDDCRDAYRALKTESEKKRLICDFIAGMTDKYAIEFYGRLTSIDHGPSFFKPL